MNDDLQRSFFLLQQIGQNNTRHCAKKATIHQVTIMLVTSENVLFPGNSHLLTTGTDDLTL